MITARLRAIADRARRLNWANWRRMGIGYALGVAVMTLLVIAGWRIYAGWRTGRVELLTEGDPMVVQVLAEDSDTPIGEPFDLATRAVVELPDGDYRLRVDGKGRMGRTFRFAVNRGETLAHSVSIDEGRLLTEEPGKGSVPATRRNERWIPFEPVTIAARARTRDQAFCAVVGCIALLPRWLDGCVFMGCASSGQGVCRRAGPGAVVSQLFRGPGRSRILE